jgi:hypothetical protein
MPDATAPRSTDKPGFSSRWMLDSGARREAATTPVAGDANAVARAIDTDGDGVADTLSVRVDAEREGARGRLAAWIGRSVVTLVLVAALVAAAAAGTAYVQSQRELDRTTAQLDAERAAADSARQDAASAHARVAELEGAAMKAERDELAAENEVLRRMVLGSGRTDSTER